MKPASAKAKGSLHERRVADILRGFGYKAQRAPLSGAIPWMKEDVVSNFPFFIECKNTETTKFLEWYRTVETKAGAKPPIIIWTKNRTDMYCFVKFSHLLAIMNKKPIQPIAKPMKPKRQSIEDTKNFAFSKYKQVKKGGK